jgi:hypothetical protein
MPLLSQTALEKQAQVEAESVATLAITSVLAATLSFSEIMSLAANCNLTLLVQVDMVRQITVETACNLTPTPKLDMQEQLSCHASPALDTPPNLNALCAFLLSAYPLCQPQVNFAFEKLLTLSITASIITAIDIVHIPSIEDYLSEVAKLRGARPGVRGVINHDSDFPREIPPDQIINPGKIFSAIPRLFQGLQMANHHLQVNNRGKDWNPGVSPCPKAADDKIRLYHGFKLADGHFSWFPLFTGFVTKTGDALHAWKKPHNALIESTSVILAGLQKKIGVPDNDGARRPFMHGPYLANAELLSTAQPSLSEITKTGSGSAMLCVLDIDKFTGKGNLNFRVQAQATGDIGVVTFKWSLDGGLTWEKTGLTTRDITEPAPLTEKLRIYWIGGDGYDFVNGDYWDFTAYAKENHLSIPGAPFEEITTLYLNGEELTTGFEKTPATGEVLLTDKSGRLKARVLKDYLTHPVDIIQDILAAVGLDGYINTLSFARAKDDSLSYTIGVRFENLTAAKAIQFITQNCLYFFWAEQDRIYLQAYTGSLI